MSNKTFLLLVIVLKTASGASTNVSAIMAMLNQEAFAFLQTAIVADQIVSAMDSDIAYVLMVTTKKTMFA